MTEYKDVEVRVVALSGGGYIVTTIDYGTGALPLFGCSTLAEIHDYLHHYFAPEED